MASQLISPVRPQKPAAELSQIALEPQKEPRNETGGFPRRDARLLLCFGRFQNIEGFVADLQDTSNLAPSRQTKEEFHCAPKRRESVTSPRFPRRSPALCPSRAYARSWSWPGRIPRSSTSRWGSPTFQPLRTSSTLPTRLRGRATPATLPTQAFPSCVKPWRTRSPGATVTKRVRIK